MTRSSNDASFLIFLSQPVFIRPLEVIGHDGKAANITMVPGDLVLYESHSVLHGVGIVSAAPCDSPSLSFLRQLNALHTFSSCSPLPATFPAEGTFHGQRLCTLRTNWSRWGRDRDQPRSSALRDSGIGGRSELATAASQWVYPYEIRAHGRVHGRALCRYSRRCACSKKTARRNAPSRERERHQWLDATSCKLAIPPQMPCRDCVLVLCGVTTTTCFFSLIDRIAVLVVPYFT
jgi:hypothetical protein